LSRIVVNAASTEIMLCRAWEWS